MSRVSIRAFIAPTACAVALCCCVAGCGKEEVDPHPAIPRAQDPAYQKAVQEKVKEKYSLVAAHHKAYEKFKVVKAADTNGTSAAYKEAEAEFNKTKKELDAFHARTREMIGNRIQQDLKKSKKDRK